MKKSILIISAAAACVAACSLGACSCNNKKTSEYDALNAMQDATYSQITLTVTETYSDGLSLESNYFIEYSEDEITVEYTFERFSSLSIGDSSTNFKTLHTGAATIKNGEVIVAGEDAGVTESFANPKFTFRKDNFENAVFENGTSFSADVKNAASFWGLAVSYTDMKVYAVWVNDEFSTIKINYTQNGVAVEYRYIFSN